jgi:glycosyltransferase involved in cell wall biosynthesis
MDWLLLMIYDFKKISCVMVTLGRLPRLYQSIECYLRQTYPYKELIILSQGSEANNQQIKEYLYQLNRSDIVFQEAPVRLSLGAMRNLSCELATGTVICQWDDDDLYHPERLIHQYKALISNTRAVASASTKFFKYFEDEGRLYWCDWVNERRPLCQFLPCSVMFYKRIFNEFKSKLYPEVGPQSNKEEDLNVLAKFLDSGVVVPVGGGFQYTYVYHGNNVYGKAHHQLTLLTNSGKQIMSEEVLKQDLSLISNTLQLMGISKKIKLCSLEGEVCEI